MDLERHKELAKEFQLAMDRGDAAFIDSMMAPDFMFDHMEELPVTNTATNEVFGPKMSRAEYLKYGVPACQKLTQDGMHFEFDVVVAEGPYVALFGSSNATALNGKRYSNHYSWLYRFAGDKVDMKREYKDTYLSRKVVGLFE